MKKIKDENSKDKILKSAAKLFAQKGFDGVSIREICKDADVNICMVSYYFGGKQELYQGIIDDLIDRQTKYANTFLDLNKHPSELTTHEQINLLIKILDKFVDFFYSNVSTDLITLLLKEQQKENFIAKSPALDYLRELVACVLDKDANDRVVIFKTLFIISQINSPRILPGFSLRLLGQDDFIQDDIKIIKENVMFYVKAVLKEAKVD